MLTNHLLAQAIWFNPFVAIVDFAASTAHTASEEESRVCPTPVETFQEVVI